MSFSEQLTITLRCDGSGCNQIIGSTIPEYGDHRVKKSDVEHAARKRGWQEIEHAEVHYWYCPECLKKPQTIVIYTPPEPAK